MRKRVNPRSSAFHKLIRKLHGEGLSARAIAERMHVGKTAIYKYLRNNELIPAEQGRCPLLDYTPSHFYDDEWDDLPPLRRRELEAANAAAFRQRVEYEMTLEKANRYISLPVAEVMERESMTMEQARYVIEQAYNFVRRLGRTEAE